MLVAYCRLYRHCHNLAEGGCLLLRFHFTCCRYFLGHVTCRNLPWQGLQKHMEKEPWHPLPERSARQPAKQAGSLRSTESKTQKYRRINSKTLCNIETITFKFTRVSGALFFYYANIKVNDVQGNNKCCVHHNSLI